MIEAMDHLRPTALPALLFLVWLPLFLWLSARHTRIFFALAGAGTLVLVGGPWLAGGLVGAVLLGYGMVELLARARQARSTACWAAWVLLHAGYLACFRLPLPAAFGPPSLHPANGPGVFVFFSGIALTFFRLLAYAHDRLKGGAPRLALPDFLAFMLYFPQLRHGPIERAHAFAPLLSAARKQWKIEDLRAGLLRIAAAMFALFAAAGAGAGLVRLLPPRFRDDPLAVSANPGELSAVQLLLWMHVPAVALWLIESGFASLQLGVSRAFGVAGSENFRMPFLATNPRDLWHRWNITLSGWLRDYAYIPLGGNRRHRYANIVLVFLYCAALHGLQLRCLAWGLWAGGTLAAYLWLRDRVGWAMSAPAGESRRSPAPVLLRALCRLLTFHWFSIGVTILLDPQYCGLRVLRRYLTLLTGGLAG